MDLDVFFSLPAHMFVCLIRVYAGMGTNVIMFAVPNFLRLIVAAAAAAAMAAPICYAFLTRRLHSCFIYTQIRSQNKAKFNSCARFTQRKIYSAFKLIA